MYMMERPRPQPQQEVVANHNYPAPPVEVVTIPQQPVAPVYESNIMQELTSEDRELQQNLVENQNFERMPEEGLMSNTFQILSEKKRLKNRFEMLDSLLSPQHAPLVETQSEDYRVTDDTTFMLIHPDESKTELSIKQLRNFYYELKEREHADLPPFPVPSNLLEFKVNNYFLEMKVSLFLFCCLNNKSLGVKELAFKLLQYPQNFDEGPKSKPNSIYRFLTGVKDKLLKPEPASANFHQLKRMTLFLEKHLKYIATVQQNKKELSEDIRTILADPKNKLFVSRKKDLTCLEEKKAIQSCRELKEGLFDHITNDISCYETLLDLLTLCKVLQHNMTADFDILKYFSIMEPLTKKLRDIVFR